MESPPEEGCPGAGTGSVGIEAMSRGAATCHFIELDPWVVERVLSPNVAACGLGDSAIVHTMRAEEYLRRAKLMPEYAQRFDFVRWAGPCSRWQDYYI